MLAAMTPGGIELGGAEMSANTAGNGLAGASRRVILNFPRRGRRVFCEKAICP
jgi:hypothetical protein